MSTFFTLMRREFAENRGGLFWTPVIVAAVILGLSIISAFSGTLSLGNARIGEGGAIVLERSTVDGETGQITVRQQNGQVTITTPDGETTTMNQAESADLRAKVGAGLLIGTSVVAGLFVAVMAVVVVFALLDGPAGERKDRSVLFWKSMPASDLETMAAKLATPILVGFPMALAAGAVTQAGLLAIVQAGAAIGGAGQFAPQVPFGALLQVWGTLALGMVMYVLWMAPLYGWLQLAASIAPRAGFVVAFGGLVGISVVEGLFRLPAGVARHLWDRITGEFVIYGAPGIDEFKPRAAFESLADGQPLDLALAASAMLNGFGDWRLWAGFVVCAACVVAASEIRRRVAL
jgi:ABC-2 type transport system permease protein